MTYKGSYFSHFTKIQFTLLINPHYLTSQDYSNLKIISNVLWLQNSVGRWGFVNEESDQVSFDFDEFKLIQSRDGKIYFQVKRDEKLGVVVKEKNSITPFFDLKYESIKFLPKQIIVKTSNDYRVLDYSKKDIFGNKYESVRIFYKHFFVELDNQWFLLNSKGEKIIEESFEELANFQKGNLTNYDKNTYAKYKATNQKFGLINALGEKLTEPIFDDIVYRLSGGYIMVKNGEKLRWYHTFKHEYASDIEFDSFFEQPKKVYCLSKDKWYYTGNFYDKFYFKELKLPTSNKY